MAITDTVLTYYNFKLLTSLISFFFFFNDPPPTEFSPLPLHAALPIPALAKRRADRRARVRLPRRHLQLDEAQYFLCHYILRFSNQKSDGRKAYGSCQRSVFCPLRSEEHTSELQSQSNLVCRLLLEKKK